MSEMWKAERNTRGKAHSANGQQEKNISHSLSSVPLGKEEPSPRGYLAKSVSVQRLNPENDGGINKSLLVVCEPLHE